MNNLSRDRFNASFSVEQYKLMLEDIERDFPGMLDFRVAETPVFVDRSLKIKLLEACNEIIERIMKDDFKAKTDRAIPPHLNVPGESAHPHFLAIDFAVTKNTESEYEPQLIELQGFPSLFAYQSYLSSKYRKFFDVDKNYSEFFNRMNAYQYSTKMKDFLTGGEDPEHTILLEIYPEKQKTRLDFALTKQFWGIEPVCITKLTKSGKDLYYEKDGRKILVKRIYNRLIFDDLERNYPDLVTEFKPQDEVNVQWITHPNWFFRVSKFCMPLLKSKYVPVSHYLSDLKDIPHNLEDFVLKPLFSFAGSGVKIDVTREDIEAISDPENYLLQQKITYDPCIRDVEGKLIKAEIRMLYIWEDGQARPKLMTNLARLSRGKMIGVDFNKNFDWVGGSSAFFETN